MSGPGVRRRAWTIVAAGAAMVLASLTGVVTAGAQDAPAGLQGYSLVARAPGFEVTEDQPAAQAHPEGQGTIGEATAQLSTGTGYALSSVAWPGSIGGNFGTLLIVLGGGDVPEEAKALNYPIRAEARSGQTEPDVSFDQVPGTTMDAHADPERSEATAAIDAVDASGLVTVGNLKSHGRSTLEDGQGVAEATSVLGDIKIGDLIEIASVTSTAKATTDGEAATGTGETKIKGLTIAGQEATIDEDGLSFGPLSSPLDAVLREEIVQGLEQAGITIAVSQPTSEIDGPNATATAGSLVFLWEPPDNPSQNVFTVTLGGASAVVGGAPGLDLDLDLGAPTSTVAPPPAPPPTEGSADVAVADDPLDTGPVSDPAPAEAPADTTSGAGGEAAAVGTGEPLVATPIGSFEGITAGFAILGLAGALVAAHGLRKLSNAALLQTATVCDLGG